MSNPPGRPRTRWADIERKLQEACEWACTPEGVAEFERQLEATRALTQKRAGRGRPKSPDTPPLEAQKWAAHEVIWLMDSDETPDWELRNEVEDWLLQTRLTPDSIWESDLAPDDLSQVEAEQTDFTEPGPRRVLEALIAKRLLPKNKLETVLRLVAYKHDLKRITLIEYRRGGGSGATRRARARHRNRGG